MANDSKYVKNRNLWRRVYPRRRQKPRLLQIVEPTGVSASIDLSRQVRTRDYFEYIDPVSGSLVLPPGPTFFLPPCTNLNVSGGFHYFATTDTDQFYILTGSNIGAWRSIEEQDENSGAITFGPGVTQGTATNQPTDQTVVSGTVPGVSEDKPAVLFDGVNDWINHKVATLADFMHFSGANSSGGTSISVVRLPPTVGSKTSMIWSNHVTIFTNGSYLQWGSFGSFQRFRGGVGVTAITTFMDSANFQYNTDDVNVVIILRNYTSSSNGFQSIRVNGHQNTRTMAAYNQNTNNIFWLMGARADAGSQFFSGSIYYQALIPRVLTDDECICVENWADLNWNTSGSLLLS